MTRSLRGALLAVPAALALLAAGAGCEDSGAPDSDVVALLLPGGEATRWAEVDRPTFADELGAQCPDCELKVYDAGQDPDTQAEHVTEAKRAGADVIVLAAVDSEVGEDAVVEAGETPVVAYDRFLAGADYLVWSDPAEIGRLQAQTLVAEAGRNPRILVVGGPKGDPSAGELTTAADKVFQRAKVAVLAEGEMADQTAAIATKWVTQQLERLDGVEGVDAVYAASDAQAGGVIEAFQEAGRPLPAVTGAGAEVAALQRIIAGQQTMTVYQPVAEQATRAARIAATLVAGDTVEGAKDYEGVPTFPFEARAVTVEDLTNTVVRDGAVTIDELCTKRLRDRCEALGIA